MCTVHLNLCHVLTCLDLSYTAMHLFGSISESKQVSNETFSAKILSLIYLSMVLNKKVTQLTKIDYTASYVILTIHNIIISTKIIMKNNHHEDS